jgi:hypothetical protein
MIAPTHSNGYSADVRMQLYVNGHAFRIGQLGPDFLILDDPADLPPAEGEITMSIDGEVSRWKVQLPDGISVKREETRIAS